ncbi:MAG: hypothetical protein AAF965_08980, partial [Pseudomonadota bacterium]
ADNAEGVFDAMALQALHKGFLGRHFHGVLLKNWGIPTDRLAAKLHFNALSTRASFQPSYSQFES